VRVPSTRKLAAIEHDMLMARDDRIPCAAWEDVELRRHRGLLYCLPRQAELAVGTRLQWHTSGPLPLPAQLGHLRLSPAGQGGLAAGRLRPMLEVRFRSGGELFRPAGDVHHRKLKKLLQSSDVLPWWRDRLPLIYCDGQLAAVADLWIAHEFAAAAGEPGIALHWERGPRVRAEHG
jgi:tRNA(Ile)-lysidine synthase